MLASGGKALCQVAAAGTAALAHANTCMAHPEQCTHLCIGTVALASRPSKVATSKKRSTPALEAAALPPPALRAPAAAAAPLLPLGCPAGSRAATVAAASWNRAMLASRSTDSGVPLRFRCGRQGGQIALHGHVVKDRADADRSAAAAAQSPQWQCTAASPAPVHVGGEA